MGRSSRLYLFKKQQREDSKAFEGECLGRAGWGLEVALALVDSEGTGYTDASQLE
jgi:hypothetical protein